MKPDLDVYRSEFRDLLGADPHLEVLARGFAFTEGPVWHRDQHYLLFTDIPGNRIHRWSAAGGPSVFRDPSHMANGLAWDGQGRLLCCEHATSRLTALGPDGSYHVLAERYDGKELNSPNDVIVARDGTVYFTDPVYGREEFVGIPRAAELAFRGVYALDPATRALRLLVDDFAAPNGLCLSADESRLFINDSERNHIRCFSRRADGTLAGGAIWAVLGEVCPDSADGMKLNAAGYLFCCGPNGIHVFSPDAERLGVIRMPEFAANLVFGGPDGCDLFITATTSLYRLRMAPGCGGM